MNAKPYFMWTVIPILLMVLVACGSPASEETVSQEVLQQETASGETELNIRQTTLMESDQPTAEISTEELLTILAEQSAMVFDARSNKEFAISHIPGAVNVAMKPGAPPDAYVSDVAEVGRLVQGNKAAPMVLYCSGPFCGKSKRLAGELVDAGYTNVRRYQLGRPTWRALVGLTQIESEGVEYVSQQDQTAVWIDARDPSESSADSVPNSQSVPLDEVKAAKKDGRLPMEDHNTRIIVFGSDEGQAEAVAEALAKNAFHNVSFFAGSLEVIRTALEG